MIIRNMTADFGRLARERLELQPGLNVIELPNESGKSTWCAFLRCMLYGVDTSRRERAGQKPDKLLYAPWSGVPMGGVMELEWRGHSITLRRMTRQSSAPMRDFTAAYTGTGEPVRELSGSDAGWQLTGATEEVFRRTAFISQGSMSVLSGPELEKKIAAIVTAGEEDVSFSQSEDRLRQWQRVRRWRGKGRLPELEEEQRQITARLQDMAQLQSRLESTEEPLQQLERRCARLTGEGNQTDFPRREEALVRLDKAQERQRKLEETAALRMEEARQRRQTLYESPFAGADPAQWEDAVKKAEQASSDAARAGRTGLWVGFLLGLIGVVLALAGRAAYPALRLPGLGTLLAGALWLAFALLHRQKKRRAGTAALRVFGVDTSEALEKLYDNYAAAYRSAEAAERLAQQVRQEAELAAAERQQIRQQVIAQLGQEGDSARLLRESEAQLHALREQRAALRARLETMGDKPALTARLSRVKEEIRRCEREYRALEIALDELDGANSQLQVGFSPALARRTAHWLSALTGGRYSEVTLDRDLSAMLRREGDLHLRESVFLSRGTCDQLYLALRLALCEMVLPEEEPCPIVLDDALLAFDDERLGLALEALSELAKTRQILLFTCQDRENRYLNRKYRGGSL